MRSFRIVLAVFLTVIISLSITSGQEKKDKEKNKKTPPGPVMVKANVKVSDAAGNLVNGLKAGDVKIFEDGVEQKITYFGQKGPTLNLGLIMDNTGSVRMQLKQLVFTGRSFVDSLSGAGEAMIVRFVSSSKVEIIQEWTHNKTELNEALAVMYIEGGQSAVVDALYLSVQKLREREVADRSQKYALVLISDVEERASYYEMEDLREQLNGSDIQIFVIGLTGQVPKNKTDYSKTKYPRLTAENLAHTLALETGGSSYIMAEKYTDEELKTVTKSIVEELRYQYVIGYTSTNQTRDGAVRKLRVEIADGEKGEKRQGSVRESFVVPKN